MAHRNLLMFFGLSLWLLQPDLALADIPESQKAGGTIRQAQDSNDLEEAATQTTDATGLSSPEAVIEGRQAAFEIDPRYAELRSKLNSLYTENREISNKIYGSRFPPNRTAEDNDFLASEAALLESIVAHLRSKGRSWRYILFIDSYELANNFYKSGRTSEGLLIAQAVEAIANELFKPASLQMATFQDLYSDLLQNTGFSEEAISRAKQAFEARRNAAFLCGQSTIEENITYCKVDVLSASYDLSELAQSLYWNGKQDQANKLVTEAVQDFRKVRDICGSGHPVHSCDFFEDRIVDFEAAAGRFFQQTKNYDAALKHRKAVLGYENAQFDPCDDPLAGFCSVFSYTLALDHVVETLIDAERRREALEMSEAYLPKLLESLPFQDSEDAPNGSDGNRNQILDLLDKYVRTAHETGQIASAEKLLTAHNAASEFQQISQKYFVEQRLAEIGDELNPWDGTSLSGLREAIQIARDQYGTRSSEYAEALEDAARSARGAAELAQSRQLIKEAVKVRTAVFQGPDRYQFVSTKRTEKDRQLYTLDMAYNFLRSDGFEDEALALLEEYIEIPAAEENVAAFQSRAGQIDLSSDSIEARLIGELARLQYKHPDRLKDAQTTALHLVILHLYISGQTAFFGNPDKNFERSLGNPMGYKRHYLDDFSFYADTYWTYADGDELKATDPVTQNEVLLALQHASTSLASFALNRQAVDNAILSEAGPELLERRTALLAEQDALSFGSDPDWHSKFQQLNHQSFLLNQELQKRVPAYFSLIRPAPLSPEQAKSLFSSTEAGVMLVPSEFGTHVMVVSGDGLRWHRSDMTADEVAEAVNTLRGGLDQRPQEDGSFGTAFDRSTAYRLYRELLAPVEDALEGKDHLFIAASGALTSLPPSVLVSEAPQGDDADPEALRGTAWLDEKYALIQIPSLQSLQFLRQMSANDNEQASKPFIGFGDPVLEGQFKPGERMRSGGYSDVAGTAVGKDGLRLADVERLRALPKLSETETEITLMAQALLPPSQWGAAIRTGYDAEERDVKQAVDLSEARVLAFATHGLLAGEEGVAEPGLVFTPPGEATLEDDGLLTASEITALDLNAEWVILSACNTAAGDTPGAPGLSGLARAFFYAGAQSLLASHWPVLDEVAPMISVQSLRPTTKDAANDNVQVAVTGLSRAQAFARAVQQVRNDKNNPLYAHPAAWAPFVLIGDK